jgi:hypothetical protein
MFALVVRFELVDEYAAQGFDALLAEALPYISAEPGTLLYLAHTVENAPSRTSSMSSMRTAMRTASTSLTITRAASSPRKTNI